MKSLTRAEEQVMQNLWELEKAFLKEIVDSFGKPKPVYTTISSIVRILITKEFIGFRQFGSNRQYYPLISRENYLKGQFQGVLGKYFQGSFSRFASFYAESDKMSLKELEEMEEMFREKAQKERKK